MNMGAGHLRACWTLTVLDYNLLAGCGVIPQGVTVCVPKNGRLQADSDRRNSLVSLPGWSANGVWFVNFADFSWDM